MHHYLLQQTKDEEITHTHIYMCVCVCVHMYIYMCVCVCIYIYIYIYVRIYRVSWEECARLWENVPYIKIH